MLHIFIMCGGSGTRLWPLSRNKLPKQFIKITDNDLTMFQITCNRVKNLNYEKLWIVSNVEHQFLIKQQLDELNITNYTIVAEPFGKNTAPVVALSVILTSNPKSNILILGSDHIFDDNKFCDSINNGINMTKSGIVTFGIKPSYPETGYGYIKYSNNDIIEFVEKPNKDKANEFFNSNCYLWNSGNFLFLSSIMENEFKKYQKNMYESIINTVNNSYEKNNVLYLNSEYFSNVNTEDLPIDIAIMEKHKNGKVLIYDGYWSDIGSFKSLYDHHKFNKKLDINNNYVNGDIVSFDTNNCYIHSNNKLVTTNNVNNLAIIETKDSLYIGDINESQNIKNIVKNLKNNNRNEINFHAQVFRPWGWFINLDGNDYNGYKVKKIGIYPGKKLSLQSHNKRSEHWVIVKGTAKIQVGKNFHILHSNQSIYIPMTVLHRAENIGENIVEIIETQIGEYLGEDDIIRYEDDFGRI